MFGSCKNINDGEETYEDDGALWPVQTCCVNRSRIGQFNASVKHGQLENALSYCVFAVNYAGLNEP